MEERLDHVPRQSSDILRDLWIYLLHVLVFEILIRKWHCHTLLLFLNLTDNRDLAVSPSLSVLYLVDIEIRLDQEAPEGFRGLIVISTFGMYLRIRKDSFSLIDFKVLGGLAAVLTLLTIDRFVGRREICVGSICALSNIWWFLILLEIHAAVKSRLHSQSVSNSLWSIVVSFMILIFDNFGNLPFLARQYIFNRAQVGIDEPYVHQFSIQVLNRALSWNWTSLFPS